ncbi:tetratricopeptide repeat protein [Sediminispirochaeta smaragdinae]|uniref:Uncharacterized protein n=1 Tax=Sediminispirochaeta smaragdinae (strain DSM 11293 / JCM 15392 / SEBR 4228) TaxID=573413 RepID=E1R3C1_SEDSS|nr:hypothetical protein [Sediminispirochaeta smaragdinae]ADK81552.1 hypothetical protein Spirs_2438 [Sediminispirochaeta smaragdinae DSM 11293]
MRLPRLGNRALVLLILILSAATVFLGYYVLKQRSVKAESGDLEKNLSLLKEIDRLLLLANYQQAGERVTTLLHDADSASLLLQLSKRASTIARDNGDFSFLEAAAVKGHRLFDGREDFAALYAYTLLRRNRWGDAVLLLKGYTPFHEDFTHAVYSEALFHVQEEKGTGYADYHADELEQLARQLDSRRIMADALLIRLRNNDFDGALELGKELRAGFGSDSYNRNDELLFLLFFEHGEYDRARQILEASSAFTAQEKLFLYADILMKTGNPIQAAETFKAIVRQFPSASWTPYYNLQILEEKTLKQNEPVFWLDRGAFLFGRNEHYLLASAAYCLDRSYMDEAKRYLKLYLDAGGNSAIADLFLEQSSGNAKPGRYRASLQQVIESSPKEVAEQRVKHGIWFFYGLRSAGDIGSLGAYASERWPQEGWPRFSIGLGLLLSGSLMDAEKSFKTGWELDNTLWEAAYNAGVLARASERLSEAMQWFRKAESSVPESENRRRALIYTQMAEIERTGGNRENAERYIRYALDIDPENASARSFYSLLDDSSP